MGPSPSKIQTDNISSLSKNLLSQFVDPKISQKFQKAQFFYKTRQMKIHLPVDNKQILTEWESHIKIISDEQIKKYILLPKQYEFQNQGYCGSAGIVKIVYDYFPYSLQGEIENRKKSINNDQFTQSQIWKLLYILLKSCHLMHLNWKKVGDIRPKNIFLNSQKQIRISSQISNPRQLNNFQKFVFERQATYIAPQQLHDIKMGRIQPDTSRNAKKHIIQAQSWSVGLTLLHVTLLFNFQRLYQPVKNEANLILLSEKISDLQRSNKYSLALKNIIKGMLQEIPERRLLCSELFTNHLEQYSDDIINMIKFDQTKINLQIKQLMQKKAVNSLIGNIWNACSNGLIQSLVINANTARQNQKDTKAKQAFIQQLQKFSQIPPKNSQVSMRQSIRLGGSIRTLRNSLSKIKTSQVSNESFHTVNSKKSSVYNHANKVSNFSLENRFATGMRIPTNGSNFSPTKNKNFQMISDKFATPLGLSSYFHTINNNSQSFDMNNFGAFNSVFRNSQALDQKDYQKIKQGLVSQQSQIIDGNFKKNKANSKNKHFKP